MIDPKLVEQCISQLLKDIDADDEFTGQEISEADKALHDAPSYHKFQDFVGAESAANVLPGHELCIALQAGFQLGRRVEREQVRRDRILEN